MTQARHTKSNPTPGPWTLGHRNIAKCDGFRFHRFPISGSGQAIASVWDGSADRDLGFGNGEANARLIAAAPELLAALQFAVDTEQAGWEGEEEPSWMKVARATIAKARGE